ncbi:glycerophosphoryl diester phosphodiesterase [Acidimicrobium ferrooxidans DSM 10331]|uniref:Glycerophosphoryl diester phosphodiesterase n=1 Tax=Acidimicrobium ferrooxidans (strain DSM 10331 / JCM 15462 / NBRC 103882 / ICP) TaxID=525909 RepID=C7M0J8_ACIFD|nr:glycerophosphodiester phosphodiesterase [Acidimicrobium ferrooxidans]ACU54506.1 glycerophosphoryl diester phosphodiesterase [Acidimicrobium ferrooxidans DSM 10331]
MGVAQHAAAVALWSHRGRLDGSALTENTVGAVEAALRGGADGIEIDVWPTTDGAFVLHHDPDVDGVTIQRAPSTSLRRLPTLEDVLEVVGSSMLDIELKLLPETGVRAAVEASVRLVELVRERDALISSFDERAVRACLASGARAGLIVEEAPAESTLRDLEELGLRWLLVGVDLLREGWRPPAVASWDVGVWTVNDEEAFSRALSVHPTAIITDVPIAARGWLGAVGHPSGTSSPRRSP